MKKVIILRGLPGSGKTTYAKKLVESGFKRVNKDDIRSMVDNGRYSKANEKLVVDIRDMIIDLSLVHGFNVVVDDTNFERKHVKQILMISEINKADVEVVTIDTPIKECVERDSKRSNPVGKAVIEKMAARYKDE